MPSQRKYDIKLKTIKNYYEENIYDFDSVKRTNHVQKKEIFKNFMENTGPGMTLTDIGCGTGSILKSMRRNDFLKAGIDISYKSLQLAKKKGVSNLVVGDNEKLPVKNNKLSHVLSMGVIHHTLNAYESFKELIRITCPGGTMFLSIYDKYSLYYIIYKTLGLIKQILKKSTYNFLINKLLYPLYYLLMILPINIIISKNAPWISYKTGQMLFNDELFSPKISFHSKKQISKWIHKNNCVLEMSSKEYFNQMMVFLIRKRNEQQ